MLAVNPPTVPAVSGTTCSPKVRPDYGSMSTMIAPLCDPIRRQPCFITRAIAAASTHKPISLHGPASCKPMPIAATTSSTAKAATRVSCCKRAALPMRGGKFFELADVVS